MWETGFLNWDQFILQWFIRFPEFEEFTGFQWKFCSIWEKLHWRLKELYLLSFMIALLESCVNSRACETLNQNRIISKIAPISSQNRGLETWKCKTIQNNVAVRMHECKVFFQERQECIPVGCVPQTCYHMGVSVWGDLCLGVSLSGGSLSGGLPNRDPPDRDLPWTETLLDRDSLDRYATGQRPPDRDLPLYRDRHPWTETSWIGISCTETPWTQTPWTQTPLVMWPVVHDRTENPPPWTESQTRVKHYSATTSSRSVKISWAWTWASK